MNRLYYSRGKLLITGEYVVLQGANALVQPLKYGQHFQVNDVAEKGTLVWRALVMNTQWFVAKVDLQNWVITETNQEDMAMRLVYILKEAHALNPDVLSLGKGFEINTNIDFDINWGLGSSSALVTNIAQWFMINPFTLHFRTSPGSGADIAGAVSNGPVIYNVNNQNPVLQKVNFRPPFSVNLWLVYSGKKVVSDLQIEGFLKKNKAKAREIDAINDLTLQMSSTHDLYTFMKAMGEHESILETIVGSTRIKKKYFSDFEGEIKSLGAWGGDFILAASPERYEKVKNYFKEKGMNTMFSFDEFVIPC